MDKEKPKNHCEEKARQEAAKAFNRKVKLEVQNGLRRLTEKIDHASSRCNRRFETTVVTFRKPPTTAAERFYYIVALGIIRELPKVESRCSAVTPNFLYDENHRLRKIILDIILA